MKKIFLVTWIFLALSACQHAPVEKNPNRVAIAKDITLQLLLPKNNFTTTQKITAQYSNTQHTLLMQVQASPQTIVMAGLAPSGTRLFSLHFDGNTIDTWQSPLFSLQQVSSAHFDARYALADFELTTLDHVDLQSALSQNALLTDTIDNNGVRVREVRRRNGDVLIHIEYRDLQTQYCHRERHYCLQIEILP